jgi:phosphatidylethanolamine-binding protein (PEBP) family uncharacterized protein
MRVLLAVSPTYQRCLVLATAVLLLGGCGEKRRVAPQPKVRQTIEVSAFAPGRTIATRYTCDGANVAPSVRFHTRAGGRRPVAYAIVLTDPDAPGGTFVHWTRWGAVEGRNSFGKVGYSGPCPPKGDKPHRDVLSVYGLRRPLGLPPGAPARSVFERIAELAVASGRASATYGR